MAVLPLSVVAGKTPCLRGGYCLVLKLEVEVAPRVGLRPWLGVLSGCVLDWRLEWRLEWWARRGDGVPEEARLRELCAGSRVRLGEVRADRPLSVLRAALSDWPRSE